MGSISVFDIGRCRALLNLRPNRSPVPITIIPPYAKLCHSFPISLPYSYRFVLSYGISPTHAKGKGNTCDIKEKMLGAEFSNKISRNFFNFKRSQKFAVDLEKNKFFFLFYVVRQNRIAHQARFY